MELVAYSYEPAQIKDLELEFLRVSEGETYVACKRGAASVTRCPYTVSSGCAPARTWATIYLCGPRRGTEPAHHNTAIICLCGARRETYLPTPSIFLQVSKVRLGPHGGKNLAV